MIIGLIQAFPKKKVTKKKEEKEWASPMNLMIRFSRHWH